MKKTNKRKKTKLFLEENSLNEITETIKKRGSVKIHKLGSIYVTKFKKISKLNKDGKAVNMVRIGFKASKVLKDNIN